jgi:hypothetical protein
MEGNDVRKIYFVASVAPDLLAGGDPGFAALPYRLALDDPVQIVRDNRERFFPVHQGLVHSSRQGPGRLESEEQPIGLPP